MTQKREGFSHLIALGKTIDFGEHGVWHGDSNKGPTNQNAEAGHVTRRDP